jgi:hypothetical protein
MLPGPTEPTADQLQNYLTPVVDDLITLYEDGIRVPTPSFPKGTSLYLIAINAYGYRYHPGRLVQVVLLGIVCDHPAMCKMSGLADHGHKGVPCGKCTVTHDELSSDKAIKNGMYLSGIPSIT